ncbi:hypothetical protein DFJ73DRAFT_837471 [Zopfochytrium polystomum]|nr:hypothetical protein DFJ73DRAFT_837471 [Zopfochytrium polystomum]
MLRSSCRAAALLAAVLAFSASPAAVDAYYLPGVAPTDYALGDPVRLQVNALTSIDSKSLLPYDYYYGKFHFCEPDTKEKQLESLGSILFGDRLYNSPFKINVLQNTTCAKLCTTKIPKDDAAFVNARILEGYYHSWFIDGLPAAQVDDDGIYEEGFGLGSRSDEEEEVPDPNAIPYLNNHFDIQIEYYQTKEGFNRIVGVLVSGYSTKIFDSSSNCNYAGKDPSLELKGDDGTDVTWTYNVFWTRSQIAWGTRWDKYLKMTNSQIHWFSIVNSIVIVLLLTGMIAMILLRALHKDILRYNALIDEDGGQEDFGWKLVHADVFRPPPHRMLLSVLLGNGAQLFMMIGVTLVFAVLGFLSPSSRGSLVTMTLVFYVCFAGFAGYTASRVYKMLQGEYWRQNLVLTATLVPGTIFIIFVILNFFLIGAQSSAAIPFGTLFALIALWFLISIPLCVIGAYLGFKQPAIEFPVKTNQIPRQVPTQPLYLNPYISALIGGILPFGAIFIELWFIMNSIWLHRIYYVFGFLFLVFFILIVTCAEVAVLMCYFHLCAEDWRWQWRSFMTAGASGFYVFLYSIVYYVKRLQVDNVPSAILYFGWSLVFSFLFFIATGFVGYVSCLLFVRKIFSSIKVD